MTDYPNYQLLLIHKLRPATRIIKHLLMVSGNYTLKAVPSLSGGTGEMEWTADRTVKVAWLDNINNISKLKPLLRFDPRYPT